MYRLKANVPGFTVVDGPFQGRTYLHGQTYDEVPPQEAHKFNETVVESEDPMKQRPNDPIDQTNMEVNNG